MRDTTKRLYYIYHIPGKKIGVTRNIKYRVELMQGYSRGEYEVVDSSDDIEYVSRREIELQRQYGYAVDPVLYKNLFKSSKMSPKNAITFSDMTTTFPFKKQELSIALKAFVDHEWETKDGLFKMDENTIEWISKNAQKSMFNDGKSYIYNKALAEYLKNGSKEAESDVFDNIRAWAQERGLYDKGDVKTQYVKLMEEGGELAQSIIKQNDEELVDAIGDMVVVLTNLAHLAGHKIEDCIQSAYNEISNRKGKMVNGSFVKRESL